MWFPDGTKIAYRTDQGGMFEKDVTGTGTERVLLKENVNGPDQVSADGKWILYFKVTPGGNQDVYVTADDRGSHAANDRTDGVSRRRTAILA